MSMRARIGRLFVPPVFEDEEKTRVARLLYIVLWIFLAMTLVTTVMLGTRLGPQLTFSGIFTIVAGVVMTLACVGLLFLVRRGWTRIPAIIVATIVGLFMTYWVVMIGGLRDGSIMAYSLLVAIAGLLLGGRAALVSMLFGILALTGAYVAETSGVVTIRMGPLNFGHLVVPAAALALTGLLLRYAVDSMSGALDRARRNEHAQREANRELTAMRETLEERVAERTRDLERYSAQLRAASEVSQMALVILDPEHMLQVVVDTLRQGFGLYHVAVFMLDESRTGVVYRVGSGEVGRAMREHGLRLALASPSKVVQCVTGGRTVITEDVSEAVHSGEPPYLPGARAEAVLPLIARGQVIGALELQSDRPAVFDADTLAVLRTVADQIATALDNARLFAESQAALETVRRAYGEVTRQAWAQALRAQRALRYRCDALGVARLDVSAPPLAGQETPTEVRLPIRVREQVLGGVRLRKPAGAGEWSAEEVALVQLLTEQLGVALESARLYDDAQRRAIREQVLSQVSEHLSRTLDLEALLQVAVRELGQWPDVADASIHLGPPDAQDGPEAWRGTRR